MANYTEDTKTNTDLHQQMPAQNPTPEVDIQGIQHYTLENDQPTTHRNLNKEEKMEVDRTYTQEISRNLDPSSHHMEPPREEVKRQATKHRHMDKETKEMGYTRREMERMATDRIQCVPWSLAYAPSEQTGISM